MNNNFSENCVLTFAVFKKLGFDKVKENATNRLRTKKKVELKNF